MGGLIILTCSLILKDVSEPNRVEGFLREALAAAIFVTCLSYYIKSHITTLVWSCIPFLLDIAFIILNQSNQSSERNYMFETIPGALN